MAARMKVAVTRIHPAVTTLQVQQQIKLANN